MTRRLLRLVSLLILWCAGSPLVRGVRAHDVEFASFRAEFFDDGTFHVDATWDAEAFLADIKPGHMEDADREALRSVPPGALEVRYQALRRLFLVRVKLRFDDEMLRPEVVFPRLGQGRRGDETPSDLPGQTVRLEGKVPDGARSFVFWGSRGFGVVTLDLVRADGSSSRQILQVAERSEPFPLERPPGEGSKASIAWDYVVLGFEHIVPKGLDHILFVLGLFLLGARWKPLLWQITAFTVAHSVTLCLAMLGYISLPGSIVEPLIALSIAYVALENLFTDKLHVWRPTIVFTFGLLHGMGFAGVLGELGLPQQEFVVGLISFNVGVEFGQLAVVAGAFLVVGWWRKRDWYRKVIVAPVSVMIAMVGLYWAVERVGWI